MSGCDAPIKYEETACACDHGEDDPCCSETDDPQEEKEA